MDIRRPSYAHAKKIRRIIYASVAVVSVAGVTFGVTGLLAISDFLAKA